MADQETPGFTVVDKRRAAQENAEVESVAEENSFSETLPHTEDPAANVTPDVSEATENTAQNTDDYSLPDPSFLLSMAAMQMDARSMAVSLLPLFDGLARRALGLIAEPNSGETRTDLPTAQLAIDCVQFFLGKLESSLPEPERREMQRRLNDLRMNYLARLREA